MATHVTAENKFRKLIVIGDRVLVRLTKPSEKPTVDFIFHPVFRKKKKYNRVIL